MDVWSNWPTRTKEVTYANPTERSRNFCITSALCASLFLHCTVITWVLSIVIQDFREKQGWEMIQPRPQIQIFVQKKASQIHCNSAPLGSEYLSDSVLLLQNTEVPPIKNSRNRNLNSRIFGIDCVQFICNYFCDRLLPSHNTGRQMISFFSKVSTVVPLMLQI